MKSVCNNCGSYDAFKLLFTDEGMSIFSCKKCEVVAITLKTQDLQNTKVSLISYVRLQEIRKTLKNGKPTPETFKFLSLYSARDKELAEILNRI